MNKIIDGKAIADKIKDEIVAEIVTINGGSADIPERPHLAIILVGDRKDSEIYVNLKEREAKKVGIDTSLYKFPNNSSEKEILETIDFLNKDQGVDGILLQLPLPLGLDTDKIITSMDPRKDVDCFHPNNLKKISDSCDFGEEAIPPLIQVVFEIFSSLNIDIKDKQICAVVNSDILGDSFKKVLECRGASVSLSRADEMDLATKTAKADILISAVGRPKFIKKDHIKEGACLIDIGITKEGGKIFGDIDMDDVVNKAGYVTPVPGGVGPITIATALRNTLYLYKKNKLRY